MDLIALVQAEHNVAGGTAFEHDLTPRELLDQGRVLDGAHPVADAGHGQVERRPHALRTIPFAGVDCAAQTRLRGDGERRREVAGGVVGLVARQVEAHHVRVGAGGRVARHIQRMVHTEVAHRDQLDSRLDSMVSTSVVDAPGDRGQVALAAQAGELSVVGGHDQLDVDRALRAQPARYS